MTQPFINGMPGVRTARTASNRIVFRQGLGNFLSGNFIINGADSRDPENTGDIVVLRPGRIMGLNSTDKKYAPWAIGTLINAESAASTALELSAAQATELVRRIGTSGTLNLIGPPTAGGTVITEAVTYTAVDTSTGVVTCDATTAAFIAGSVVADNDGTETPVTFVPDGWGIRVTDPDDADADVQFPRFPVGGTVDFSQLLPAPTDTSLVQWVIDALGATQRGNFVFDNAYL